MSETVAPPDLAHLVQNVTVPHAIQNFARAFAATGERDLSVAMIEVWRTTLRVERDDDILIGIATFANMVGRANDMLTTVRAGDGTKQLILNGLQNVGSISNLREFHLGYGNIKPRLADNLIMQIGILSDISRNNEHVGVLTESGSKDFDAQIAELHHIASNLDLPSELASLVAARIESVRVAVQLALSVGADPLFRAANNLSGLTFVMRVRAAEGKLELTANQSSSLEFFAQHTTKLLDNVGRVSLFWDGSGDIDSYLPTKPTMLLP